SFDGPAEAALVDALRVQAAPVISLVADADDAVVGHILFSPVTLDRRADLRFMGLGPMAVAEGYRRRGIGSALVREGLAACRQIGVDAVVVVGHPAYYARFGFSPASRFELTCEYDVPDDVFMACELSPARLAGASGVVTYHPAFTGL